MTAERALVLVLGIAVAFIVYGLLARRFGRTRGNELFDLSYVVVYWGAATLAGGVMMISALVAGEIGLALLGAALTLLGASGLRAGFRKHRKGACRRRFTDP